MAVKLYVTEEYAAFDEMCNTLANNLERPEIKKSMGQLATAAFLRILGQLTPVKIKDGVATLPKSKIESDSIGVIMAREGEVIRTAREALGTHTTRQLAQIATVTAGEVRVPKDIYSTYPDVAREFTFKNVSGVALGISERVGDYAVRSRPILAVELHGESQSKSSTLLHELAHGYQFIEEPVHPTYVLENTDSDIALYARYELEAYDMQARYDKGQIAAGLYGNPLNQNSTRAMTIETLRRWHRDRQNPYHLWPSLKRSLAQHGFLESVVPKDE